MAAGTFQVYDIWKDEMGKSGGNMSSVTFQGVLVSAAYTPNLATDLSSTAFEADSISASAGNLSATFKALTLNEWSGVGSNTFRFDFADITFTTSAIMKAKYFVVRRESDEKVVCYCDLETTQTTGVEATKIIVQPNSSGVFSLV